MSSMIDMVGAAILFGVLILAVGRVQGNLNQTMAQNTFNLNTQSEAIYVARLIEYEVSKAGYGVTGSKISVADDQSIAFKGAMTFGGAVDSVAYYIGEADTTTMNPNDFRFVRYAQSSGALSQRLVMTQFAISYFDSSNTKMTTLNICASALKLSIDQFVHELIAMITILFNMQNIININQLFDLGMAVE